MKPRLSAIKSLIRDGIGIIDVGTDHGYLPIDLSCSGYQGKIIASDINISPLDSAKRNSEEKGIYNIDFRLSDGLSNCNPDEVDTIVIAGMGGDLICRILDEAEWTMNGKYNIILQPMTKAEVLRFWLVSNGYSIINELFVRESGKIYCIMQVNYTGTIESWPDANLFVGKLPDKDIIVSSIKSLEKKPFSMFYRSIISELKELLNDLH